ncbi:ABC transporter permease [bacterium]|nr:ABC transporter permease [bacterium]
MNLPLYIAIKYFFSKKKIGYVHLLSIITQVGIAIGTAALVLVLSVFNGFENLVLDMYNVFDPHIKITSAEGKNFQNKKIIDLLLLEEEINVFSSVLEEKVLVEYNKKQYLATIKGVDTNYNKLTNFDSILVNGDYIDNFQKTNVAVVGRGVAYYLSMNIGSFFENMTIYLPNRNSKNMLKIENAFVSSSISPVGIFGVQQEIDSKYIITPISFVQNLIQKQQYVSAIEINLKEKSKMLDFQKMLSEELGEKYLIKNQYQQQDFLFKILNTERLVVLLILIFIMIISAFNIISSLAVLIIDKKKDIDQLNNLGLDKQSIRKVFTYKSMLGVLSGSFFGLLFGFSLAYLQQEFGFVKMGEGSFVIDAYPAKILLKDLIFIQIIVLLIGFVASLLTSRLMLKIY